MCLKTLYILLSLVGAVIPATTFCRTETPCKCVKEDRQIIDLTSTASEGIPRFYEVNPEDNSFEGLYSFNPCLPFDSPDKVSSLNKGNVACKGASACVRTPSVGDSQLPEEHALGLQASAVFGISPELGVHITYSVPDAQQKLTVKLVCNRSIDYHLSIDTPEDESNTHVVMTFTSKCACENGCSSNPPEEYGLSTGSKLLIAFFTILLAYFVVGIVWNLCNGAQGVELVPNLDFWNDLPKLVIEGVLFTCSCCGKKRSYGEV